MYREYNGLLVYIFLFVDTITLWTFINLFHFRWIITAIISSCWSRPKSSVVCCLLLYYYCCWSHFLIIRM